MKKGTKIYGRFLEGTDCKSAPAGATHLHSLVFTEFIDREDFLAHEMGHNFGLRHTFARNTGRTPIPMWSTRNIMDYPKGWYRLSLFFRHQVNQLRDRTNELNRTNR